MLHEHNGSKHRCVVNRTDAPFGPVAGGRHSARRGGPRREAILGHPEGAEERRRTRRACSMLSKRNLFYRVCLMDAGAVSWLLHLLSSADATVQSPA